MTEKVRVFISWSGERSRLVARALADWLPDTLQTIECWVSDADIGAGARWSNELQVQLDTSGFGILCLTPENLDSRWMLFEAGYLAKSISNARIVPYILDLKPTDVPFPLAQFQSAEASFDGTLKLLQTLNSASVVSVSEERVFKLARHWWPELDANFSSIPAPAQQTKEKPVLRDDRALLEEILAMIRSNQSATVSVSTANVSRSSATSVYPLNSSVPGRTTLHQWPMRLPQSGGGWDTMSVSIPWRFLTQEASSIEPKTAPILSPSEIRALPDDELSNYEKILDLAWSNSNHDGYESYLSSKINEVKEEQRRRHGRQS